MRHSLKFRSNFPPKCCLETSACVDILAIQNHLDDDILARLTDVFEEFSSKDPTFCINPPCGTFIPVGQGTEEDQFLQCLKCKTATCTRCKCAKDKHVTREECPESISKEDKELIDKEG